MATNKERILAIIEKRNLSAEDKNLWNVVLKNLSDELCVNIANFVEMKSDGVELLTSNIRNKAKAIEAQDEETLAKIFKKEQEMFDISKI